MTPDEIEKMVRDMPVGDFRWFERAMNARIQKDTALANVHYPTFIWPSKVAS